MKYLPLRNKCFGRAPPVPIYNCALAGRHLKCRLQAPKYAALKAAHTSRLSGSENTSFAKGKLHVAAGSGDTSFRNLKRSFKFRFPFPFPRKTVMIFFDFYAFAVTACSYFQGLITENKQKRICLYKNTFRFACCEIEILQQFVINVNIEKNAGKFLQSN